MKIRCLEAHDLPGVLQVQRDAYRSELLEAEETFSCMLSLFPDGCLGCFDGDRLVAYVFSHPWHTDQVVPLDHHRTGFPDDADCLYIHDMAVARDYRGRGLARRLLDAVFNLGEQRGVPMFALVAVQDSEPFWEQWGFERGESLFYVAGVPATHMVLKRSSP